MIYLIGLGLNEDGISKQGLEALKNCKKVYLEGYTVNFPYDISELKLSKKIIKLERGDVESNRLIKEAKSTKIALLVYGSPLFATTHMSLILDAHEQGVRTRIIYSASVFDAIASTGLQLYKFGKTASMPSWQEDKKYRPESFMEVIKENQSIKAHTLLLIDIGLDFEQALYQLEQSSKDVKLDKIIVCEQLGTKEEKIYYDKIKELEKLKVKNPFCFIIPSEFHFLEREALEKSIKDVQSIQSD